MHPPFLSLCILTRNEANNLPRCIESLRPYADEILVGDTGSTDGTPELALSLGASLIPIPWQNDFSAARNALLDHARGRYILFPDADMFLAPESHPALQKLLESLRSLPPNLQNPPAYRLLINDVEPSGNRGMAYYYLRLFPNLLQLRYRWPIHEQIEEAALEINLPIHNTEITLLHTGYITKAQKLEKQRRNLSILNKILSQPNPHPIHIFLAAGARLDIGEPASALTLYHKLLLETTQETSELANAAIVRVGTCLAQLGRWQQINMLELPGPRETWHPELLVLRGQAALKTQPWEAREWFELALASKPQPLIPPYSDLTMRSEAASGLATWWKVHAKKPELAIELLKLTIEAGNAGKPFSLNHLQSLYQKHGIA